ncbi:MAG: hypothetical protein WCJ59_00270 [bacterium]
MQTKQNPEELSAKQRALLQVAKGEVPGIGVTPQRAVYICEAAEKEKAMNSRPPAMVKKVTAKVPSKKKRVGTGRLLSAIAITFA